MPNNAVMILLALLMVALAGLFAGAETGMYQLSRVRLRIGIEKRRLSFLLLGKVVHDGPGLLLTTLIGTNLAHFFATSIVTTLLLSSLHGEHTAEVLTALITTPVFFIFSELIPKSVFLYRADRMMPYISPVLFVSHRLLTFSGIIPTLKFVSTGFARIFGSDVGSGALITAAPRHHISTILAESREEGLLSRVQVDIVNRLVTIGKTSLRAVMTPISGAWTIDINSDAAALLEVLKDCPFTRLPVYEDRRDNIIGFVNIYDALAGESNLTDLRSLLKPIARLSIDTSVTDAIDVMKDAGHRVILVHRKTHSAQSHPVGIVTMKDLVEELVGELGEW